MKIISQETFDEVVLENIIEFENSVEEAVHEATKEFEAQGVQLGNIVMNPRLSDDKAKLIHDVIASLSVLEKCNNGEGINENDMVAALRTVTDQCKMTLAHRVLATKHNAYNIVLSCITTSKENNNCQILNESLQAMCALTVTNSDILTRDGTQLLLDLLDIWETRFDDEQIPQYLARWSLESCLKHEGNRHALFDAGVPKALKSLLFSHKNNKLIAKTVYKALRAFTLDDDIRIEFGNAHEHARFLVEELDMIKTSLNLAKDFLEDCDATSELLATLSQLCVRAEYCQSAVDHGALMVINDILVSYPDNIQLNKQGINLLRAISGNDRMKEKVMKSGAHQLIIAALMNHLTSVGMCEAACGAISMLALRAPTHAEDLAQHGAAEAIVQAMKMHPQQKSVQKFGCLAVRNLVARVPENRKILHDCEVESVIRAAYEAYESDAYFKDLAKAALRDMELDVKLEEQWKGVGVEIDR